MYFLSTIMYFNLLVQSRISPKGVELSLTFNTMYFGEIIDLIHVVVQYIFKGFYVYIFNRQNKIHLNFKITNETYRMVALVTINVYNSRVIRKLIKNILKAARLGRYVCLNMQIKRGSTFFL